MAQADIRYSEKIGVGDIEVENVIWFWDDDVDITQITSVSKDVTHSQIRLRSGVALRFAEGIIDKYKVKGE